MKTLAVLFLFAAVQLPEREVVRRCLNEFCAVISIQGATLKFPANYNFHSPYDVGPYLPEAQKWVPANEAPIRELTTANKWRVIVSAFLDEYDFYARMRLRIFDPDGQLQQVYDGVYFLDHLQTGELFGTSDVILAMQTSGYSAFFQDTALWVFPASGEPKEILRVNGILRRFQPVGSGESGPPGVWIDKSMYDGTHAETRFRVSFSGALNVCVVNQSETWGADSV